MAERVMRDWWKSASRRPAPSLRALLELKRKMLVDGMVYRNGKNFYKSTLTTILTNVFYTGVFIWNGRRYENAAHEPIITKELFNQVQNKMTNPFKSKSRKGLFTYTNFIKCGVCGCVLTAEVKKEKYIYYHCTGYKGNCKQTYLRQETIDGIFEELCNQIEITEDIQQIVMTGLRDSLKDKIEYHNNLVEQIERQIKLLQSRIDQAYLDKLDGKISEEFWQSHTKKWITEKEELAIKFLALQKTDAIYLDNANLILELAKKAAGLFKQQNAQQKRRLVNLLVSNCTYKAGNIDIELKPVFNEILKTVKTRNWCTEHLLNLHRLKLKKQLLLSPRAP